MVVNIYHEKDADISILRDSVISIIGYGNQGRSQALNLRDSGLNVIVGNIEDNYKKNAVKDGFETISIEEAVKNSNISFILIPDEIMKEVFERSIKPNLKEGDALVFASGYNVGFDLLALPDYIDVLMIAPRMIGIGVRETFLTGEGFFSFIAAEQDYTGNALGRLLALSKGVGTLKKGAIKMSCKDEAVLDLFNEQAFGPAFGRVLLTSINTLIDAGYPPEAVLIEMYMSGEMSYTYQKMAKIGLVKQTYFHSHTSQYGAMSRGIRYLKLPIKPIMERTLKEIESGEFVNEWKKKTTKAKFKLIRFFATKQKINKLEKQVRKNLKMKSYDIYEETPPSEEEMKELAKISDDIKRFEEMFE
ncbi:MAG: ketol-acid reductoisomerase [Candidatus Hermodarchaeota archaeon]